MEETIDLTKTVSNGVIGTLMAIIVISIVAVVFLLVQGVRKYKGKVGAFFLGILGGIAFGSLLGSIILGMFSIITGYNLAASTSVAILIVSAILLGAVTILGMFITQKIIMKRYDTFGSCFTMSVGYALVTIFMSLFYVYNQMVVMIAINQKGGFGKLLEGMEEEKILDYARDYDFLFSLKESQLMLNIVVNLVVVTLVAYTSVIIYNTASNKIKAYFILISIAAYSAIAVINSLMSHGHIDGNIATFIILAIGILYVRYVVVLDKTKFYQDLRSLDDSNFLVDLNPFSKKNMNKTYKKNKKIQNK